MNIKSLLVEVRMALEILGYNLDEHTFCIVVRPDLVIWQCEVRLDNEYFGIWDTNRKTFVD